MYYPGDTVAFYLSLARPDAEPPVVSTPPQISVLAASTDAALDIGGAGIKTVAMPAVEGADALYKFLWDTSGAPDGSYAAVVSYVADDLAVTSRLLDTVRLGDSRVTTPVAGALLTAQKTDLPDKAAVMLKTDFVAPADDASVQAILAKTNALPAAVASQATSELLLSMLSDVHDYDSGNWSINKSVTPNQMTFYRVDGSVLQVFDLIRNDTVSARSRH